MFQWVKEQIARQILRERGARSEEMLKWEVALRLYGDEPVMRAIIQRKLADVSG